MIILSPLSNILCKTTYPGLNSQLVFDLSRWDGQTGRFDIHLTLSDDNNILTISDCLWNNIKDTEDCPMVMQRK